MHLFVLLLIHINKCVKKPPFPHSLYLQQKHPINSKSPKPLKQQSKQFLLPNLQPNFQSRMAKSSWQLSIP